MKTNKKILLALLIVGVSACTPKPQQRMPHEPKKDWGGKEKVGETVAVTTQDFNKLDLVALDKASSGPAERLEQDVLRVLSPFVWNPEFISLPANQRDGRIERAISILHLSFARALKVKGALTEEQARTHFTQFENAIFSECQGDLRRGCINASLLATSPDTSQLLYFAAIAEEAKLDKEIEAAGSAAKCVELSEFCRTMIHLRYRRLAMALMLKRNREIDEDVNFAFMKYARVLSVLVKKGEDVGYLNATYTSIFEKLIARYTPKNPDNPEFRKFIENFIPWNFSNNKMDEFRSGSKALFDLAAQCCLYEDAKRTKLSPSIEKAIEESQKEADPLRLTFYQMVTKILGSSEANTPNILSDLGMNADIPRISNLKSGFYNEYFFLIDRLFNDHLDSNQAMKILERTNPERLEKEFLNVLLAYMRVHLANLTLDTTDFMTKIYNSSTVSSDQLFQEAITVSKELSTRWMRTQTQLALLDGFMRSYYNRSAKLSPAFVKASRIMRSFNRNVHYLSVYPNMIGMTYFLAKKQGVITARSWWGETFEIKPETVVEDLFEGNFTMPWFKFSADTLTVSRERLLLAFYYALKTRALDTFAVEENDKSQSDRSKFFELTIGKYLEKDLRLAQKSYENLERLVMNTPAFTKLQNICTYEASDAAKVDPSLSMDINLGELGNYTYTGQSDNGINEPMVKFLSGEIGTEITRILQQAEPRRVFSRAVIALVEDHLKVSGETTNPEALQKELAKMRAIVSEVETHERRLLTAFMKYRKKFFDCSRQLYNVELHRSYRIYEEERKYLGRAHDLLTQINTLPPSAERTAKTKEFNETYYTAAGAKFDSLQSDGFKFSKYDFLMRVRSYVEQDIFAKPSEQDLKLFKERGLSAEDVARMTRRRPVRVIVPPGIERADMYAKAEAQTVDYVEIKEEFIRNGMKIFSGKPGAFAEWISQADQIVRFKRYLDTIIDLYLMGNIGVNGQEVGLCQEAGCVKQIYIEGKEILDTFKSIIEMFNLTSVDIELAPVFGVDGRTAVEKLEDFVLEQQSLKSDPLLKYISKRIYDRTGFDGGSSSLLQRGRTMGAMLTTEGEKIFEPDESFAETLVNIYTQPIFRIMSRGTDLLNLMPALENDPSWKAMLDIKLRVEDGRVISFKTNRGSQAYDIIDKQILSDFKTNSADYSHITSDMFGTKKLKVLAGEER